MMRLYTKGILFIVLSAALAACQSRPPQISIRGARAELSPAVIGEAMATMKIVNQGGADMLAGIKTNIPGATASFHVMQGQRMVKVDMLKIDGKSTLEFKMGGDHIMIENMPKTMVASSPFTLTLIFEKSGEKQLQLTLEKAMAMPMPMDHSGHQM